MPWRNSQPSAQAAPDTPLWTPQPGPQTLALESDADELLYGGAAGAGKSDLLLGMALTQHSRAIVFRREYTQLRALVDRSKDLIPEGQFNATTNLWRLPGSKTLEFGAVANEDDWRKWRGRPHDLKAFDELTEFTERQYVSLIAWARTTNPSQRVRIVGATNPPSGPDGEWVIQRWGAWLDEQHPNPAEPGELRWYAMVGGVDTEVEDGAPFEHNGEMILPRSRTFIPGRLEDNPILEATGYRATLQALPEPLRSQLLYGDWQIGLGDDPWQVIPSAWVRAAQARWTEDGRGVDENGVPLPWSAIGADVAGGGADCTVLARRRGEWFAELEVYPGTETPDAKANAELIQRALLDGGVAHIDGDGIGASTYFLLEALRQPVRIYLGSGRTTQRDRTGKLEFANVRAAAHWLLREALDPSSGSEIALPPDRELRVDLCATRYTMTISGIQLEKKEDVKKRLGRSPDKGDAVVMAHWVDKRWQVFDHVGKTASLVRTPSEQPANVNPFGEKLRLPASVRPMGTRRRR